MMLFGAVFAIFERRGALRSVFTSSYFWYGLVCASIFNIAVVYAILRFPDWMWMYFLDDSHNSVAELVYIFVFLYYLPYTLGFYLGLECARKATVLWIVFLVAMAGVEGWLIMHLFDRYSVVGTRTEYLNHTAISLFSPENPIGPVMNASVAMVILYFILVVVIHRRSKSTFR